MSNRLVLASTVLCAAVGAPNLAEAAPSWHLGPSIANDNGACFSFGDGITTQVGYYGELTPRTGDNPDSAYAVVVVQNGNCGSAVVLPDFILPPEVVQDTSRAVQCLRTSQLVRRDVADFGTANGGCSSSPIPNASNLQHLYGWSRLDPGDKLEIFVPVGYIKAMTNGQLAVNVQNNFWPLVPTISFDVDYRPLFSKEQAVSSNDGTQLAFSFKLEHFHAASQVFVDYGTTNQLGSTSAAMYADPQYTYYDNFVMPTVGGLAPGTTYYWRVRIETPYGTWISTHQTAYTYAQIRNPGPIACSWRAWLEGRCP